VKRRDPWHWRTHRQKRWLTRSQMVKTRKKSQACLDLVCKSVAQPPVEAKLKSLTRIQRPNRRWTALLRGRNSASVENSVGKPGSPRKGCAPNAGGGKERVANSIPDLSRFCTRKVERDLLFSGMKEKKLLARSTLSAPI